jgi:hypothetical protein
MWNFVYLSDLLNYLICISALNVFTHHKLIRFLLSPENSICILNKVIKM